MKKKVLFILLAVVIFVGAIGYYQWNKPKRTAESEKPAAELSSSALFDEYITNQAASNEKYLNKVILVSGKILEKQVSGDKTIVILETSDPMGSVNCEFTPGKSTPAEAGAELKVKGICSGFQDGALPSVVLSQCTTE